MMQIIATIKPFKLGNVLAALEKTDIGGLTMTDVKGYGKQTGPTLIFGQQEFIVESLPRKQLSIVVEDDKVEGIIEIIRKAAYTGRIGDGKIFAVPIEDAVRIRTNERGMAALKPSLAPEP